MKKNEIVFKINDSEKIVFLLECDKNDIFRYDEPIIVYHGKNGKEIVLFNKDCLISALRHFEYILQKSLFY